MKSHLHILNILTNHKPEFLQIQPNSKNKEAKSIYYFKVNLLYIAS